MHNGTNEIVKVYDLHRTNNHIVIRDLSIILDDLDEYTLTCLEAFAIKLKGSATLSKSKKNKGGKCER